VNNVVAGMIVATSLFAESPANNQNQVKNWQHKQIKKHHRINKRNFMSLVRNLGITPAQRQEIRTHQIDCLCLMDCRHGIYKFRIQDFYSVLYFNNHQHLKRSWKWQCDAKRLYLKEPHSDILPHGPINPSDRGNRLCLHKGKHRGRKSNGHRCALLDGGHHFHSGILKQQHKSEQSDRGTFQHIHDCSRSVHHIRWHRDGAGAVV
jgi:hypothetical protein